MSLTFSGLSLSAGGHELLSGASGTLSNGELVALLGRNGSGKTTLLRTLCGLRPAAGGTVTVDGLDLVTLSAGERAQRIAVVDTSGAAASELTVGELVSLGRAPHTGRFGRLCCTDRCTVDAALRRCGVSGLATRPLGTLSDGERQRSSIARAVAQGTGNMLLDEPTSHLDPPGRREVVTLLRALSREGLCVLFSTHEVELALRNADRLLLLDGGRLQALSPLGARKKLEGVFGEF